MNPLNLIGGLSSLYSIGATLALCISIGYFSYDKYVTVPVENANAKYTECNTAQVDAKKEYDANMSSALAMLAKCTADANITRSNAYDKGYTKGVTDAEENKINPKDGDVLCFKYIF